ncbi:MAG TPA: hypothetical protein VN999_12240 [Thermoanaerobaculia bacterium]|nr:hypothetical protein [Thermoanaerobaculia bacterium]
MHDSNMRPPALPGTGWRFVAVGNAPRPEERYEFAVAASLEGVQIFRDRCVAPCRFERIDYMAVVAFRELPR